LTEEFLLTVKADSLKQKIVKRYFRKAWIRILHHSQNIFLRDITMLF